MLMVIPGCYAQHKTNSISLKQSIALIDSAFQHDNPEDFNKLVPVKNVQDFFASVVEEKLKKQSGKSQIILADKDSALVFLSGILLYGSSGDETNYSSNYTGIYKFERKAGSWSLKSRLEIDRLNQIRKHRLRINIVPGKSITVKDTLTIDVNDSYGFATKLNHTAKLEKLVLNGSETAFSFNSGLLWLKAHRKKNQTLIIDYTINVERDETDKNSGYFGDAYGHLRNQYFWHPFFSFSSPNDRADFSLYCTIPKAYHIATSLPQKEIVIGDSRIIEAKSGNPTFGLSIYYDKDWEVNTFKKDHIDLVVYATKDFLPEKQVLYAEFSKSYDTLQKHFGRPIGNYLGIVQDRSNSNGWKNRSNSIVVAGAKGGTLTTDRPNPRATFGHEVAHGWTSPTGPATNFLTEGWATYAESVLLSSVYGDSIVTRFFKSQKQNYFNGKYNRNSSLWEDYSNSGVSYAKGAWLFYILSHQLGEKNLSTAMTNFIQSGNQSIQSFTSQLSAVAQSDMEPFLDSWLKSKEIPALEILQSENNIKIRQARDLFLFPLEFKIRLKNGTYLTKTINMNTKEQVLTVTEGEIESYVVDPNDKLLFIMK
ncbi:hypothetical protein [Pedobacter antarcticus]|uniref:hypothetical protein n=1 Tax=Pedobacter antarcticus TaxID=34086 RepID=UPI00292CFCB5|nr:hypothetical protein [Pedobacter antarcticus]